MHRQIVQIQRAVIIYILCKGVQDPDPDVGKTVLRVHDRIAPGSVKGFAVVTEAHGDLPVLYKQPDIDTVRFAVIKARVNNDDGHFFKRQPHVIAPGTADPFPCAVGNDLFRNVDCALPASSIRFVSGALRPKAAKAVSLIKLLMIRPSRIVPINTVIREISDTEKRLFTTLRMIRSSFFRMFGFSGKSFFFIRHPYSLSLQAMAKILFVFYRVLELRATAFFRRPGRL